MRADYGFSPSNMAGAAAEAASEDLHELRYLLQQAPMSWRWLKEGADVGNMLTVRQCLTELAGAAYAMQYAPVFLAATGTLLRYSLASSRSYAATPAQLLLDVAVGIALRRPEAAHRASTAILAAGSQEIQRSDATRSCGPNTGAPGAERHVDGRAECPGHGQRMRNQAVQQAHHGLFQRLG